MQGSCLALLWSPLHQWGVFLKRSSYNKTQPNGGNMINFSIKLIGANSRYVEHLLLPCMQLCTTVELFMGPAPIGFIDSEVLPVDSVTAWDCCKCCSELQWLQNELFARAAWHMSCQREIPQPWGEGVKWFPTALLFFSLLKAFKLFLALLLHHWLSPLLQTKESGVLSSTSFKGVHSLQDLLYILAKFGQICCLLPSEGSWGDAWCLRVKGGCKVSCPAQRVAKMNGSRVSGVEDYVKKDLILFFSFSWQLLTSRLPKYWGWGYSWLVLGCAKMLLWAAGRAQVSLC